MIERLVYRIERLVKMIERLVKSIERNWLQSSVSIAPTSD